MLNQIDNPATTAKDLLRSLINPFNCAIEINNKSIPDFDTVTLEQGFNHIPTFSIQISFSHINDVKLEGVEDVNNIIGKPISLQFYQGFKLEDKSNDFSGIITHVQIVQQRLHRAILIITGKAKCDLLQQGGKQNRIYQDKSLSYIAADIGKNFSGDLTLEIHPTKNYTHALVSQYEQTDFEFLNWLSLLCGECYFWDRDCLRIGRPDDSGEPLMLSLDNNLNEQRFTHNLQATAHQTLHSYFSTEHSINHLKNWPKPDADTYGNYAANHISIGNRWLNRADNKQIIPINASSPDQIAHYQQTLQAIAASNAHILEGKSIECLLRPGIAITLAATINNTDGEAEQRKAGEYIVQYVTHHHDNRTKTYSNEFTAVPNTPTAFPHETKYIQAPQANSQLAEVISNPDSYGRVQVRMHWCNDDNYSPYLFVVQPELGIGSKGKNRGHHSFPRVGDTVVVESFNGNANFLYINGAISHSKNLDASHNLNNNIRSFTTNSGHTLVFNDNPDQWGITILDDTGNKLHIDSKDKKIHITAVEEIVLNAKKISFNAEQDVQIQAGNNIITTAKTDIDIKAGKNLSHSAANTVYINAAKVVDIHGKEQIIAYADGRTDIGAKDKLHVHSKKTRLTGQDKIEYKCSTMDKVLQNGDFKYTKEPTIISADWMDAEAENKIGKLREGYKASIYVITRNTKEGDTVSLDATEYDEEGKQKQHSFSGTVQADGTAILKEVFEHTAKV